MLTGKSRGGLRRTRRYEDLKAELLRDPEVKAEYDALEAAYQVACRRIALGLTQAELAERVGTKQPGISRLESGSSNATLDLLQRVAEALNCRLDIRLVPLDESPPGG
jgi:HTH-type transcriptional regulator/antitoxin HipB